MRRSSSIAATLLLAGALAVPGSTAAGQQLAYGLPSPATATYQLADTTAMFIDGTPMGPIEIGGSSSFTYALTFAADGEGVRVSAELSAFAAQMSDPRGLTTVSQAGAGVSSTFEVVLGRAGLAEVVSASRQSGGDLPILADPHAVLFPRLPAGGVNAGDTWADTVTTGIGDGGERVVAYTYTLEEEVAHEGRPHLRVAVSGESMMSMADQGMTMNLTGSESGYYLWDIERGLMALAEVSRSDEGSMNSPDGSVVIKFTATTRVTLED